MTKKRILFHLRYLILLTVFVIVILYSARSFVFRQCVEHVDHSSTHTHTQLKIQQDGKEIPIPAHVGITDECMHPLHTHDATGLIHMEYPLPIPFFLGDFFDLMGITFNDGQVGSIKKFDRYEIVVRKNGKLVKGGYRWILLKDLDTIEIEILKKR